MIFVVGGSGGGFSTKDAIIHANAPLGSTVTFYKDNIAIKVIESSKAILNSDGETADYYYSVKSANYGDWTITATLDAFSNSTVITVDSVKEYDAKLEYNLLVWDYSRDGYAGLQNMTTGMSSYSHTFDKSSYVQIEWGGTGSPSLIFTEVIDMSKYSVLKIIGNDGYRGGSSFGIVGSSDNNFSISKSFVKASSDAYTADENLLDISIQNQQGRIAIHTGNPRNAYIYYISRVELLA